MNTETKQCQNCKQNFTIEPEDFQFYEKMKVPAPTFCPECRMIRRLAYRNERALYKRACDLCKKDKILMFPQDGPYKVYCKECWYSDTWDPKSYAMEYDFSKSFFEQFKDLLLKVPRLGQIHQGYIVNSDYANRVSDQKNSYLVYGSTGSENCRYGVWLNAAKECMDCYNAQKSERCYECIDCFQSNNLAYSQECTSSSNSWFLFNCRNCQNCFGCVNLRNKGYCIFNKQYTKEEYEKIIKQFNLGSSLALDGMRTKFKDLQKKYIVPSMVINHSNNSSGNWIQDCKDTFKSFNVRNLEGSRYCFSVFDAKDVMDYCHWGNTSERVYEASSNGIQCADMRFTNECWAQAINLEYCSNCPGSKNLFGCIGLRNAEYCIFNKQYSKEEFEALVPKIRAQMMEIPYLTEKGRQYRYGEFFPIEISPFAYNETVAQEFFPITKSEAIERGYPWRDPEKKNYKITLIADLIPDHVKDAPDGITNEVIGCAHEGKCNHQCTTAFRILAEELATYKQASLPLPRLCPNCRHYERLKQRNPMRLWPRKCQCAGSASENGVYANVANLHPSHKPNEHCPNEFQTSYSPESGQIVYCVECYQVEVV